MKIGKELVYLRACVNAINVSDDANDHRKFTFRAGTMQLFSNVEGTALYILPVKRPKAATVPRSRKRGKALFSAFTGYEAEAGFRFTVPDAATTLYKRGDVLTILYTSDKDAGGGRGTRQKYIHTFKAPPPIYSDRKAAPRAWGILRTDGKRLVTARGIIG